jgi:hypothetical protein
MLWMKLSMKNRAAFACALSAIVCAFALCALMRVDRLHMRVPFTYSGDAVWFEIWLKGIMEGNLPWHNPHLGMPLGADWHDFPITLTLEAFTARVMALFTSSSGLVLNLIWMLATAASAWLATFGFERLGIERWTASALGVVYALQPFTFFRGVSHFNLFFYLVPLLSTCAIEIAAGYIPIQVDRQPAGKLGVLRTIPRYVCVACILQGISYIYNSFFAVVLIGVAGLFAFVVTRSRASVIAAIVAIGLIGSATVAVLSPTILYWVKNGKNDAMNYKSPEQAEFYALKLRYLLTPIPLNPFPPLEFVQKKLDAAGFASDAQNEATTGRLGTVGSVGLLFLLGAAVAFALRRTGGGDRFTRILGACTALTLACILIGTVGGFGSLFSVFVSPEIRAYNRISVFIEFFAIAAIGLLLTKLGIWLRSRNVPRPVLHVGLLLLVIFAAEDQAFTAGYRDHVGREAEFKLDDRFVGAVESKYPKEAEIFQLPVTEFPMYSSAYHMFIYDQGKAYLHSHTLRWNFAAITGRDAGAWDWQTASLPVPEMLNRLSIAGFSGIWIDRFGYEAGKSPERDIAAVIGAPPLQRSDGRIAVYDLRPFSARLNAANGPSAIHQNQERLLHPVRVSFESGFYPEERNDIQSWHWSGQHSVLHVQNTIPLPRVVRLVATLQTGDIQPDTIKVSGEGQTDTVAVTAHTAPYVRIIQLPANQGEDLTFDCICKQVTAPGDSRTLYFSLINFKIVE